MEILVNGGRVELPEEYRVYEDGMYKYCLDCPWPFKSYEDKMVCGWHWRPKSGTKYGFPLEDGTNCARDMFDIKMVESSA
jgi:hypothetical protein